MENQKSFHEIKESIMQELFALQKCRSALKSIFENTPKEFAKQLHDNYLGVGPTRAVLSGHFHGSLNKEERLELLQILEGKFIDDPEK